MNKAEFISFISKKQNISKIAAAKIIDIFTDSVTSVLSNDKEISLVGFGRFSVSNIAAKNGRNPRTGEVIKLPAYRQPRFKAGLKLKDACN